MAVFVHLPISLCSKGWQAFFSVISYKKFNSKDCLNSRSTFFHGIFNTLVSRSEDLGFTQICKTMVSNRTTVIWNWNLKCKLQILGLMKNAYIHNRSSAKISTYVIHRPFRYCLSACSLDTLKLFLKFLGSTYTPSYFVKAYR